MEVGYYVLILLLVATTGIAVEEQVLLNFYNSLHGNAAALSSQVLQENLQVQLCQS